MKIVIGQSFLIASLLLPIVASRCGSAASMEALLEKADFAVIGEIPHGTFVNSSHSFTLVVHRSLKGGRRPGVAIPVNYEAGGGVRGSGQFSGQHGLWFIVSDKAGGWTLIPPMKLRLPLEWAYYPLPKRDPRELPYPEQTPLLDAVFLELAAAAEFFEGTQSSRILADGIRRSTGAAVSRETFQRWSRSPSPNLSTLGLTGLVRQEDSSALVQAQAGLAGIRESQIADEFVMALTAYRNPNSEGLRALGEIATRDARIPRLQLSAAIALRSIHTKESLPYFAKLLEASDADLRKEAVAGFTSFVRNLPIATPRAVQSMEWLRPAGEAPYQTEDTERYSNLGKFADAADERAHVEFWKNWWLRHESDFATLGP